MRSRQARAKLNLGLHVLRRRADGYHDLETVFLPIQWTDTVTVEPEETLSFTCDDESIEGNDNLCMRAAIALRERAGTNRGVRIHLTKRIPYGAGLGGGSSDAAVTLQLLADLWGVDPQVVDVESIAGDLGSDVPFFLMEGPAFGSGRGEILEPLIVDEEPYVFPFHLVVAVPSTRISTGEAYHQIRPNDRGRVDIKQLILSNDPERWRHELVNDFEEAILEAFPEVASLKQAFYDAGAVYASMSGSGSAVYGVFDESALAEAAAEAMRETGHATWHGMSTS